MNRSILIQLTIPAVVGGLLISSLCLVGAWHVQQLQQNLVDILAENVASMRAAQQLEVSVRRLRFHCLFYLIDPNPESLEAIHADQLAFEHWLRRADELGTTAEERDYVRNMRAGYERYLREFEQLRKELDRTGLRRDFRRLAADEDPIRHVIDPSREYQRVNEELMSHTAQESNRIGQQLRLAMFLLGVGGPLGGLLGGYGIALGLRRRLHRLSVRIHDVTSRLDQDVATVSLSPDGDLGNLDRQLQHVVQLVSDVTDRAQRQQRDLLRAQQLAAVGQLAASVAHEIRNPLTSIKLLVEAALRDQKPRPFTPENLKVVHAEILRLEQTVQHFLDLARPPALQRRPDDLREVVARAVELVHGRARQQHVEVAVHCPDAAVTGAVDANQLCTVLVNLFLNALDAMPGGGRLEVCLEPVPAGARVTVTDTGPGISPAMAGRLFTPFASTKPTGSGLGLSVSRRIVEEHGGRITAADRPTSGACFIITLPAPVTEERHVNLAGH